MMAGICTAACCCVPRYPLSWTTCQAAAGSKESELSPCLLNQAWQWEGGGGNVWFRVKTAPSATVRQLRSGEVWPMAPLPPCSGKQGNVSFPPPKNIERRQYIFQHPPSFEVANLSRLLILHVQCLTWFLVLRRSLLSLASQYFFTVILQ